MLTDINKRPLSVAEIVAAEAGQKINSQDLTGHVRVDQALVDEAAARAARGARASDLIVVGGFGHSRLRQFLFGGVTVDLTQVACRPLLMAY